MLTMTNAQMAIFSTSTREPFIQRLSEHLQRCDKALDCGGRANYQSPTALQRLGEEVDYLQQQGFLTENEVVEAVERIELFGLAFADAQTKRVIAWQEYSVRERIELLFYMINARQG